MENERMKVKPSQYNIFCGPVRKMSLSTLFMQYFTVLANLLVDKVAETGKSTKTQ